MFKCKCNKEYPEVNIYPIHCSCGCNIYKDRIDCNKDKNFPTITKQITNFIESSVNHIRLGMKIVPEEVKKERLNICSSCEYYKDNRCSQCGCFMNIKAEWADQQCPLRKWLRYEKDNNSN